MKASLALFLFLALAWDVGAPEPAGVSSTGQRSGAAHRDTLEAPPRSRDEWANPDAPLPPIDYDKLVIRLDRTACLGNCPEYTVRIDGAGHVLFSSDSRSPRGIRMPGTHHAQVSRAALDALIERFRAAHFFGLRPEYVGRITDMPTHRLTFRSGRRSWTVTDYAGHLANMPRVVSELEDAVDRTAGTARWLADPPRSQ